MYTLQSDEKLTSIMVYSKDRFIRGEVVTKDSIMVSRWLRTQGAPTYLHILKASVLTLSAGPARVNNFEEVYFPTAECLVFHLTPPKSDPLDYDADEQNRLMQPLTLLAGSFVVQGKLRVSAMTDFATSLEGNRLTWLSFYEISISNPALPQMRVDVPMALINAAHITYGMGVVQS
ncbi:MAG: hypothetical protein CVU44_03430 [Chloroflexi bacterium HGW-Chloroflexi-6]|nr:MAG: hypothetical protein CVU44_03430 [Chloroflexi bacterium HGW-Chloroflexi-6]